MNDGGGGAAGGGGAGGGGGGECQVTSTFQGQPGSLWVLRKEDGKLTQFDTQDGKLLNSVPGIGPAIGVSGGNGFLLLWNVKNDRDVTPLQPSGQTMPKLGIDADTLPVFAGGNLWTNAFDANVQEFVYSIASPTSVKKLPTSISISGFTASNEGAFFTGPSSTSADLTPDIAHIDAADANVVWTIPHGTYPAIDSAVKMGGPPQMVAIPGMLYEMIGSPGGDDIFPIDSTTHTLGTPGKIVVKQPEDSRFLMTDGARAAEPEEKLNANARRNGREAPAGRTG